VKANRNFHTAHRAAARHRPDPRPGRRRPGAPPPAPVASSLGALRRDRWRCQAVVDGRLCAEPAQEVLVRPGTRGVAARDLDTRCAEHARAVVLAGTEPGPRKITRKIDCRTISATR
jgi:hypothetical protein